jgi:hypothetical protein
MNVNPSPSTRFKPGHPGGPGRGKGNPNKTTILQRAGVVRPLDEVLADAKNWQGSHTDLLESVMRDEVHPLDTRLACANALIRAGTGDKPRKPPDLSRFTALEKEVFLALIHKAYGDQMQIDDKALPPPRASEQALDVLSYLAGDDEDNEAEDERDAEPEPKAAKPEPEPAKPEPALKSKAKRFDEQPTPKAQRSEAVPAKPVEAPKSADAGNGKPLPALHAPVAPPERSPTRGVAPMENGCSPISAQRPQRGAKCWDCGSPVFWRPAVSSMAEPWRCKKCHPPGNLNYVACDTGISRTIR